MDSSSISKSDLHDWAEAQTRQLDVVASWETLCDVYDTLRFVDQINDTMRMEEFKWIIKEMNKHLTRARRQLLSCQDLESTRQVLTEMFSTTAGTGISDRKSLAYHKLRQSWVSQMIAQVDTTLEAMEKEESENGNRAYWDE